MLHWLQSIYSDVYQTVCQTDRSCCLQALWVRRSHARSWHHLSTWTSAGMSWHLHTSHITFNQLMTNSL